MAFEECVMALRAFLGLGKCLALAISRDRPALESLPASANRRCNICGRFSPWRTASRSVILPAAISTSASHLARVQTRLLGQTFQMGCFFLAAVDIAGLAS